MASTTTSRPTTEPTTLNGLDGPGSGVRARSRTPELVAAVVLLVVAGLGSLWWYTSATERTEVVALAVSVERGDVITADDLTVVGVASDELMASIPRAEASRVTGRVALVDMAAGTVLTESFVADAEQVGPGESIVGLQLTLGQAPSLSLAPGSVVAVYLTPAPNSELADAESAAGEGQVLSAAATVIEAVQMGQSGTMFVSLSVPSQDAAGLVAAASQDRVRLAQVSPDASASRTVEVEEEGGG